MLANLPRHTSSWLAGLLALSLLSARAEARTWNVPGDAPTVQAGIDSASAGDSVLVAPGTYSEPTKPTASGPSMLIMKDGVRLLSTVGAPQTTLDAQGQGRVIYLGSSNDFTRIEGLTITGGVAVNPVGFEGSGGGIYCAQSAATIADCTVVGNRALGGGGIFCLFNTVRVVRCSVVGNLGGRGILSVSTANGHTISACLVAGNVGGGVYAGGDRGILLIAATEISDNDGPGISVGYGYLSAVDCTIVENALDGIYGAFLLSYGSVSATGCEISRNGGNGIRLDSFSGDVTGCCIVGNAGAGAYDSVGAFSAQNSLIADNATYGVFSRESWLSLQGCTVAGNAQGGVFQLAEGFRTSQVVNTILSHSASGAGIECQNGATPSVRCCNVWGNVGGDALCGTDAGGNFSDDPFYCGRAAGDYTLNAASPCLPGNHPQGEPCGLIGAFGQGCDVTATQTMSWGAIKGVFR